MKRVASVLAALLLCASVVVVSSCGGTEDDVASIEQAVKYECGVILVCGPNEKFSKKTCLCEPTNKPPECGVILICPDGYRFSKKTCLCEPLGKNKK